MSLFVIRAPYHPPPRSDREPWESEVEFDQRRCPLWLKGRVEVVDQPNKSIPFYTRHLCQALRFKLEDAQEALREIRAWAGPISRRYPHTAQALIKEHEWADKLRKDAG